MSNQNLANLCSICSHPIEFVAQTSCDHEMCSVCAIRMKLLFKSKDCVFCKQPIKYITIGKSTQETATRFPYAHIKWQLYYTSVDAFYHVMNLLRFTCPISDCDHQWNTYLNFTTVSRNQGISPIEMDDIRYTKQTHAGFKELAIHLKQHNEKVANGYKFCDVCVKDSKRFVSELNVYPTDLINSHVRSGDKPFLQSNVSDSKDITVEITHMKDVVNPLFNFDGHPLCQFCNNRFVDQEYLKNHMKQRHEECSLCKQSGKSVWFRHLNELKSHYKQDHIVCEHCDEGLIGFADEIDHINHLAQVHGITNKIRIGQRGKMVRSENVSQVLNEDVQPLQAQLQQTTVQVAPRGPKEDCVCVKNVDCKVLCTAFHHDKRAIVFRNFLIKLDPLDAEAIFDELLNLQPRLFTYPEVTDLIKWLIRTSPVAFRNKLKSAWKRWYEVNCKFPDLFVADCVARYTISDKLAATESIRPKSMMQMVNRGDKNITVGNPIYLPWLWTDVDLPIKKESGGNSGRQRTIPTNFLNSEPTNATPTNTRKSGRKKKVIIKMG